LTAAYFNQSNLGYVDLSHANLEVAYFRLVYLGNANLSHANLRGAQVLDTNLTGATLTGACIADCTIKGYTLLDDIVCSFVFQDIDPNNQFMRRVPEESADTFRPGEFGQWLYRQAQR
jgi:uncharacterized protein YjbI with pentapeptide repeats